MKTLRIAIVAVTATVAAGCTRYVEMHKADARIWIMSDDMKEVYRCVDYGMSPDNTGRRGIECIRADFIDNDRR